MPGILNALYVRGDDVERVRAYYQDSVDLLEGIEGRVGPAFVAVEVSASSDFEADPDLSADSTAFGEAIRLQLTSFGDDVFMFDHWHRGQVARSLRYAPGGWTRVEGVPEPWEERAFVETPRAGAEGTFTTEGVLAAMIKALGLPTIWPR